MGDYRLTRVSSKLTLHDKLAVYHARLADLEKENWLPEHRRSVNKAKSYIRKRIKELTA
jgi:hypothetical protein